MKLVKVQTAPCRKAQGHDIGLARLCRDCETKAESNLAVLSVSIRPIGMIADDLKQLHSKNVRSRAFSCVCWASKHGCIPGAEIASCTNGIEVVIPDRLLLVPGLRHTPIHFSTSVVRRPEGTRYPRSEAEVGRMETQGLHP